MWNNLINQLTEVEGYYAKTRNWLWVLALCAIGASAALVWVSLQVPLTGLMIPIEGRDHHITAAFSENLSIYSSWSRILTDWSVYGFGSCIFLGGLYSFNLGKPNTYVIIPFSFAIVVIGTVIHSSTLNTVLLTEHSPQTYRVFSWFSIRFLLLFSFMISLFFSLWQSPKFRWTAMALLTLGLGVFVYYNVSSLEAFHLLFSRNLLTLSIFYLPLVFWGALCLPLSLLYLKRFPSYFSFAIVLSIIPHFCFDLCVFLRKPILLYSGFNGVHALEVLALVIILMGLSLDHFGFYHVMENDKIAVRRASESKLFFLSAISNDFQLSVRKLLGYVDEIQSACGETLSAQLENLFSNAAMSIRELNEVIKSFDKIGEREAGFIEKTPFNLHESLAEYNTHYKKEIPIQGDPNLIVNTDKGKLEQILMSFSALFTDAQIAIDYDQNEGKVYVKARAHSLQYQPEEIQTIFAPITEIHRENPNLIKKQLIAIILQKYSGMLGEVHPYEYANGSFCWTLSFLIEQGEQ